VDRIGDRLRKMRSCQLTMQNHEVGNLTAGSAGNSRRDNRDAVSPFRKPSRSLRGDPRDAAVHVREPLIREYEDVHYLGQDYH
jgi:hypothetical protein